LLSTFVLTGVACYFVITKKVFSVKLRNMFTIFLIASILFAPWVFFRAVIIYDNDFNKGIQFSYQARFALQHQWDTPADLAKNPNLKLMGLGIACEIDPGKCRELELRKNLILTGKSNRIMDDEDDVRSREAIKVLLLHPVKWLELKFKYFGNAYFQKSVYDRIDNHVHYSWELLLVLFLVPSNLILSSKVTSRQNRRFVRGLQLLAIFLALQLLVTQAVLRFFLMSILLTFTTSVLVASQLGENRHIKSEILPKNSRNEAK